MRERERERERDRERERNTEREKERENVVEIVKGPNQAWLGRARRGRERSESRTDQTVAGQ